MLSALKLLHLTSNDLISFSFLLSSLFKNTVSFYE